MFGSRPFTVEPTPFDRDVPASTALYNELSTCFARFSFSDPESIAVAVRTAIIQTHGGDDDRLPVAPLFDAFSNCIRQLLVQEGLHRLAPLPPATLLTGIEGARYRDGLRTRLKTYRDGEATWNVLTRVLIESFLRFHNWLPLLLKCAPDELDKPLRSSFTTALIDLLPDPGNAVQDTVRSFIRSDVDDLALFSSLTGQLNKNVLAASGFADGEKAKAIDLTFPAQSELPPRELVDAYLKNTPYHDLFYTPVPFAIPQQSRYEHMHIVAGSGHGKTQTLQHLLLLNLITVHSPKSW